MIPNGITFICKKAFGGCIGVEYIKFPCTVRLINDYVFEDCIKLKSIFIPEGVESIGFSAFANCTALKKVVLPRSLKRLMKSAFNGCTAIEEIIIPVENEKFIMKQLPKELHPFVKVTSETLVDTTPEPIIGNPKQQKPKTTIQSAVKSTANTPSKKDSKSLFGRILGLFKK